MHDYQDDQLRTSLVETPATNLATSAPGPERYSVDAGSSNWQDAESNDKHKPLKTVPLQRSVYIVFLTLDAVRDKTSNAGPDDRLIDL